MLNHAFKNRSYTNRTILLLLFVCAVTACHSSNDANSSAGVIVVSAPAAGVVRRVLVSEGAKVEAGTPIVEIAVQMETPVAAPTPGESADAQAVRNLKSASAEIEAARAEVVRHEAEVQRLTPLVASGQASQAELDGERALYERAQQRLQKAKDAEAGAQTGLIAARQPGRNQASSTTVAPREQIVTANASSAGTVRIISARIGDKVQAGQPLATLRSDEP